MFLRINKNRGREKRKKRGLSPIFTAGRVLGKMKSAGTRLNIVILDACRDNPFERSFRSSARGLARMKAPVGSIVAYSTAPGSVASDGKGSNGLYTSKLMKYIQTPGLKIEDMFKKTRIDVFKVSQEMGTQQVPWEHSSLMGDFYFVHGGTVVDEPVAVVNEQNQRPAPLSKDRTWKEPVTGMEFVWIPGGEFMMGSNNGDSNEKPVHKVRLDGFWMGKYEVTNGQYRQYKSSHDSKSYKGVSLNGDRQPAVYVSWDDAKGFVKWLNKTSGNAFALPTEAQWEYACRAGSTGKRFWGDSPDHACKYANVHDLTSKRVNKFGWQHHNCDDGFSVTAPVGSFQPNDFGLYDMLGNVWEWCEDIYAMDAYGKHSSNNPIYAQSGSLRVSRGGSWCSNPASVRCANRYWNTPVDRFNFLGFRLGRTN